MELGIASSPEASGRHHLGRRTSRERPTEWRAYLRALGPGLVTGASDDDPSGVATYAQAGAHFRLVAIADGLYEQVLEAGLLENFAQDVENAALERLGFNLQLVEQAMVHVSVGFARMRNRLITRVPITRRAASSASTSSQLSMRFVASIGVTALP